MNPTVSNFFDKNPGTQYAEQYEYSHGPRLDALVARYGLKDLTGRVVDVGGGLGFLGKRLPSAEYWVVDGAKIEPEDRLTSGSWIQVDLDHDDFSSRGHQINKGSFRGGLETFDVAFCLETLEHLSSPYHCLEQIKKLVKPDGLIYISIPPPSVWHNTIYPGLLWPKENFLQFLGQMALPVIDQWDYQPASVGWPAWTFVCRNRPWSEKVLAFAKSEEKFVNCTPLEATNL